MFNKIFQQAKHFITNVGGIYIGWIILHTIAANLYPVYCAELSIWGMIKSAFVAPAPHCQALRWVINNGGSMINQMWIVFGIWICGKFAENMFLKKDE
jgi:hypothetical protein